MYDLIQKLYDGVKGAQLLASGTAAVVTVLLSVLMRFALGWCFAAVMKWLYKKRGRQWAGIALQKNFPKRVSNIAVPLVLGWGLADVPGENVFMDTVVGIVGVITCFLLFSALINMTSEVYSLYEISKTRPIKGILQVVQIVGYVILGIVAVAVLLNEKPAVLLGGMGAAVAVVSFVFKDMIIGLVSGIQLSGNDMVRIGDWIEVPKYNADGNVVEISLTTVKVKNFNNSITNIPIQSLANDAFINWRGMEEAGGKRIKRAINVDASGVQFCDEAMLKRFMNIEIIHDYLLSKSEEITVEVGEESAGDAEEDYKDVHMGLSNLGVFRRYIIAYLKSHGGIREDMMIMVRQLPAAGKVIPVEVYTFSATTDSVEYEELQSDIFDHLYAVLPVFGLSTP